MVAMLNYVEKKALHHCGNYCTIKQQQCNVTCVFDGKVAVLICENNPCNITDYCQNHPKAVVQSLCSHLPPALQGNHVFLELESR